jgi:predicted ATPase with chaperone activity
MCYCNTINYFIKILKSLLFLCKFFVNFGNAVKNIEKVTKKSDEKRVEYQETMELLNQKIKIAEDKTFRLETIADLNGEKSISDAALMEAIQLRKIDKHKGMATHEIKAGEKREWNYQ